jgi:transposase, IS30 family
MATNIQVYFAYPASPWERGTNENTNGLIRQYFPKGTDFSKVSVTEIKRVQNELNDRPRKVLGWKKPDEVFNQLVALKG